MPLAVEPRWRSLQRVVTQRRALAALRRARDKTQRGAAGGMRCGRVRVGGSADGSAEQSQHEPRTTLAAPHRSARTTNERRARGERGRARKRQAAGEARAGEREWLAAKRSIVGGRACATVRSHNDLPFFMSVLIDLTCQSIVFRPLAKIKCSICSLNLDRFKCPFRAQ